MLPLRILKAYKLRFSFIPVPTSFVSISRRTIASMPKADTPPGFKPLKDTALFTPFKLGPLNLEHRIVQAPLTRMRAVKESDAVFVPKDLHVKYYEQRASKGGLQLTEATDISKYVRQAPRARLS
jgi:hypothetical protein